MAYTAPTTRSDSDRITHTILNTDVVDNIAYLAGKVLPVGAIGIFDGTLPTGWTRVSAWDNKFVRGASSYGATGGADTHAHTVTGTHTHDQNTWPHSVSATANEVIHIGSGALNLKTGAGGVTRNIIQSGFAASAYGTSTESLLPSYTAVIFAKLGTASNVYTTPATRSSGDRVTSTIWNIQYVNNIKYLNARMIPTGLIAIFDAAPASGWTRVSGLDGKFIRGAAAYGATGGGSTHTHTLDSHTHQQNTSGTTLSDGASTPIGAASATNADMIEQTGSGSTPGVNYATAAPDSLTSGSGDLTPEYIDVLYYKKNAPASTYTDPSTSSAGDLIDATKYNARLVENIKNLKDRENISGIILLFDASPGSGWTRVSAFDGKLLRGASSYGGTGGAATHTHTLGNHTHPQSITGGAYGTPGQPIVATGASGATMYGSSGVGTATSMRTGAAASGSATSDAATNLPAYIDVLFYKKD